MPIPRPNIPHGSSMPDSKAAGGHLQPPPGALPPSMLTARPEDLKNYHPSSLPGSVQFISITWSLLIFYKTLLLYQCIIGFLFKRYILNFTIEDVRKQIIGQFLHKSIKFHKNWKTFFVFCSLFASVFKVCPKEAIIHLKTRLSCCICVMRWKQKQHLMANFILLQKILLDTLISILAFKGTMKNIITFRCIC